MIVEGLLEKPYWIVDILPKQVPAGAGGQYFKIEQYYLTKMPLLREKYTALLLKLNCYFNIEVSHDGENWKCNPEPATFERWVGACLTDEPSASSLFIYLQSEETLIVIERDSTYVTVYNPTEDIVTLIRQLAVSEGLFVWQPKNEI